MAIYQRTLAGLTDDAVLEMLRAAAEKAGAMGQPQCIAIVDASGEGLGELRMVGAKFLSRRSAKAKAQTAASINAPSANVPEAMKVPLGMATQGGVTGLKGGLPIRFGGELAGGIGIGSGAPDQDVEVAMAALAAIGADTEF